MHKLMSLGIALSIVSLTTSPALAQQQSDASKAVQSAITSGLLKGGEAGAQWLAGQLYDTDCKKARGNEAICAVLGSFSGRAESEWKDNVTNELKEIRTQLGAIAKDQAEIKNELSQTHQEMLKAFEQVASKNIAADIEVTIESLWTTYTLNYATAADPAKRQSMVNFAKDIIQSNLHTSLGKLNTVLTVRVNDGGEPLLRYPLAFYRISLLGRPNWERSAKLMDAYDLAEKKFLQYRMEQDKAYLLYLWAATVLENECKVNAQCTNIPRSREDIKQDFTNYTLAQTETFNSAVDWLILAQSPTRITSTGAFLQPEALAVLLRANLVTARILSPSNGGMWGRIYAMGDAWDGKVNLACGISIVKPREFTPVLTYKTPVDGTGTMIVGAKSGPLDWWTSTQKNTNYDVVRFASEWTVYHYNIPQAKPAVFCGPSKDLPNGSKMPWVQDPTPLVLDSSMPQPTDAQALKPTFGSFVAIQRAGGNYALMSGSWDGNRTPDKTYDGPGGRKDEVYDWFINGAGPIGPTVGLLSKARGEFIISNGSSRIRNRDKIRLQSKKPIQFPDDRTVKLNFSPGHCQGKLCDAPGALSILQYRVEHGDPGKLTAKAAVYFDNGNATNLRDLGVFIDGSYSNATGTKEMNVANLQVGEVKTERGKDYRLTYLLEFDLETEGSGKEYSYRGLIAPGAVFLTK